jgi:D-alanyl-D-alanine carboxypeptidase/D-alanyl-D-alanine-endopeptidase (penicillin-binding protein 4)
MKILFILGFFSLGIYFSSCNSESQKDVLKKDVITKTDSVKVKPIDSLKWEIEKFLSDSAIQHASVGIIIAEDSLENIIYQNNPQLSLVPASVLKLLTTATALELLGGGMSFKTTLQYNGNITEGHILNGNILIKGGGDPTLGRGDETNIVSRWGNAIKKLGIDSINGKIVGDASVYEDELACPTWSWGEVANSYCQSASGLTFNDNVYELRFNVSNKGAIWSNSANMKPFVPGIRFNNFSQGAGVGELETYFLGMPYGNGIDIQGYYPTSQGSSMMVGTMPDPALAAAYQLNFWLKRNGVKVCDTATTIREIKLQREEVGGERKEILVTYSPRLYSIISETNLVSRNLFAEHILKHLGFMRSGKGNRQSGLNAEMAYWSAKKMNTGGLFLHDGSGLSRYNGITVSQLAFVLSYMKNKSPHYESFKNTLPEAGKTGTMRRIGKNTLAEGRVFAKSGTMSRVSSYAGYVTTIKGKTLIFAIITNNFTCSISEIKDKYEKIMIRMAEWEKITSN